MVDPVTIGRSPHHPALRPPAEADHEENSREDLDLRNLLGQRVCVVKEHLHGNTSDVFACFAVDLAHEGVQDIVSGRYCCLPLRAKLQKTTISDEDR
jgi:hypothetical protein